MAAQPTPTPAAASQLMPASQASGSLPPAASQPSASASSSTLIPPLLPTPPSAPLFLNPSCRGALHGLTSQSQLEDGSFYLVSSSYLPGDATAVSAVSSPSSSKKRQQNSTQSSASSSSGVAPMGTWQVCAARILADGGIVWYSATWGGSSTRVDDATTTLLSRSKCPNWGTLESRASKAWHAGHLTVGSFARHVKSDGSWDVMQVLLGRDDGDDDTGGVESPPLPLVKLALARVEAPSDSLALSTFLCTSLIARNAQLHTALVQKQAKLQHARRLAGIDTIGGGIAGGTASSTSAAANGLSASQGTSLVNPGRVKRKRDDDEGFESSDGDDADAEGGGGGGGGGEGDVQGDNDVAATQGDVMHLPANLQGGTAQGESQTDEE